MQPTGEPASDAHKGLLQALLAQKKNGRGGDGTGRVIRSASQRPGRCGWNMLPCWRMRARTTTRWRNSIKRPPPAPESLRALRLRALIYFRKKQYDNAVPVLIKAIALAPKDPDLPAQLGHVYLEKKDYPNAVNELIVAIKMNPHARTTCSKRSGDRGILQQELPRRPAWAGSARATGNTPAGKLVHARHLLR